MGVDAGEADGDEDGHGEQEGDVARREEGGDLKEGEGDEEEEDDEEDKDTAEEDDDKSEDEEEEGPPKAAWDAAARDAAEDGERDRERDRDLEWGRRGTTLLSANGACATGGGGLGDEDRDGKGEWINRILFLEKGGPTRSKD